MYCPHCGFKNYGNFKFCPNCGAAVIQVTSKLSETADKKIKRLLASKTFLLLAVLATAAAIFSVLVICFDTKDQYDELYAAVPYSTQELMGFDIKLITNILLVFSILSGIPYMIAVLGIWCTYSAAKNNEEPVGTVGLTLIKGVLTFVYVIMYILIALLFIALIILIAYLFTITPLAAVIAIIYLVLVLAVFIPVIIMYAKLISTVKGVRETLRTGVATDKVSLFAAVMCFVMGGLNCITALSSLMMISVLSFFGNAVNMGLMLTGGVLLLNCRNIMNTHIKEEAENAAFINGSCYNQNNNYYR